MKGTVKRLIKDKRFGFIQGEDNFDYFFHQSALKNVSYDELKEGDKVEFEDSEGAKGRRAEDVYV